MGWFEKKDLGEYHDLYVQVDTAQLTDVFENFRSLCLKEYQLDPAYFVSTPSLANEAMLKITKAKIVIYRHKHGTNDWKRYTWWSNASN